MSAKRKRDGKGAWLRYTARDWDKLYIITLEPLSESERKCWEHDAGRRGLAISIEDGDFNGAYLGRITADEKTKEMRDAEGEPLRSMRTGYYSRDFPDFADPPPDYLQYVHGASTRRPGRKHRGRLADLGSRDPPRLAVRIAKRPAHGIPAHSANRGRWWLGDDYTREDVMAGRAGHPDLSERLISEAANLNQPGLSASFWLVPATPADAPIVSTKSKK